MPIDETNPEALLQAAQEAQRTGDLQRAEELFWTAAASSPETYSHLFNLARLYIKSRQPKEAAALVDKLKMAMLTGGRDQEFITFIEDLGKAEALPSEVMEALDAAYEELVLDQLHAPMLPRLFDAYAAAGQFPKAADALERIVALDPHNTEHSLRLQLLCGKIDRGRYNAIASKLPAGSVPAAAPTPAPAASPAVAPRAADSEELTDVDRGNILEDLILQAEIFLQYGLKPRALERVERIARQFPGEEARNDKLRSLYAAVQFTPMAQAGVSAAVGRVVTAVEQPEEDLRADITRVSEITRAIYRQSSVKEVLSTSVNEIGRAWRISRCVCGLCIQGKPPSAAVEFVGPGMAQSDVKSIVKLVITLLSLTADGNPLAVEDVASLPKLAPLAGVFQALNMKSLLALPLLEADQPVGVLILEQCDRRRRWRSSEIVALKTIVDQIVITTSHVKLRSLMKSLSVSEDQSGLLSRETYLVCLMNECARAQKQAATVSVMLLQFGEPPTPQRAEREHVPEAVQHYIKDAVQLLAGHFRQNDVAVRYDESTVALVMPDTKGKDTFFVVDKFRRLVSTVKPAEGAPPPLTVGIAEALSDGKMDVADVVTELINRVEAALEAAQQDGGATSKLLMPPAPQ